MLSLSRADSVMGEYLPPIPKLVQRSKWNSMKAPQLAGRDNLAERESESSRPENFGCLRTPRDHVAAWARRLIDIQAASLWSDLKQILSQCEGSLLDVGCGAQPYRSLLPATVQYSGIDTNEARDRFGYEIPDTIYYEGARWPVESGRLDVVLATEVLEHVQVVDDFLNEARRCLKPDGVLILTVPFAYRWHYIPYDYWRFTPSGLKCILTRAGFNPPFVYARGNEVTVICQKTTVAILALIRQPFQNLLIRLFARLLGLALAPIFLLLALVGQISLAFRGGDDCLGYTVIAPLGVTSHGEAF